MTLAELRTKAEAEVLLADQILTRKNEDASPSAQCLRRLQQHVQAFLRETAAKASEKTPHPAGVNPEPKTPTSAASKRAH